jgi:hypothetical protein
MYQNNEAGIDNAPTIHVNCWWLLATTAGAEIRISFPEFELEEYYVGDWVVPHIHRVGQGMSRVQAYGVGIN